MMHYLPRIPSAWPIWRLKLLRVQSSHRSSELGRKFSDFTDRALSLGSIARPLELAHWISEVNFSRYVRTHFFSLRKSVFIRANSW
jgi:hypothetical protein